MVSFASIEGLKQDTREKQRRISAWQRGDNSITTGELHDLIRVVAENERSLRRLEEIGQSIAPGSSVKPNRAFLKILSAKRREFWPQSSTLRA